jgi:hypothetical protein
MVRRLRFAARATWVSGLAALTLTSKDVARWLWLMVGTSWFA